MMFFLVWLQDFATAFSKLLTLGVPADAIVKPWYQFW
jgi:hypothetical protein